MDSFICLTNIPSPNRMHEFEFLSRELESRNISFEAIFMAETERGRHWRFDSQEWSFKHRVVPGMTFYLKDGTPFHLNPRILFDLVRKPPDWLLIGGAWYFPTVLAASLISKICTRGTSVLFWSESGTEDRHRVSGRLGLAMKRLLIGVYDGYVVPGRTAEEYVQTFAGRYARCIKLVEFVDEHLHHDRVKELRANRSSLREKYQLSEKSLVLLWPARLAPEKGILQFLEAVKSISTAEYTILIAGEGPQRSEIENWLSQANEYRTRLLGHKDIDQLLELYTISDVLMLPSISESYGFVAVEGTWAGLPLLLSNKVGAWPDVLKSGENGWLVDPGNPSQVRGVFEEVLACSPTQLQAMGQVSLAIAKDRFSSLQSTKEFVDELLESFPRRI